MATALTYLAEYIVRTNHFVSMAWTTLVTERVALIAVEWYRKLYKKYKVWRVNRLFHVKVG